MVVRTAMCACTLLVWLGAAYAGVPREVLHDTDIVVDATLIREADATVYVAVTGATGLKKSQPVAGAQVSLRLETVVEGDGKGKAKATPVVHELASATTGRDGAAVVKVKVPALAPGSYALVVRTRSRHGEDEIRRPVRVIDRTNLHLRTDRGVYRPGQIVRWRVTAQGAADAHPLSRKVEVTVKDPRGTAIWRGTSTTDATGMIAGEVALGDDIILGKYSLHARAGTATTSESVAVKAFKLPPFTVTITPTVSVPAARGSKLGVDVVARYTYGEPVVGNLRLNIAGTNRRILGRSLALDAHGRAHVDVVVPTEGSGLTIEATVSDGSGRRHSAERKVAIAADALAVAIVPERKRLVSGRKQWVTVITTDNAGHLAPAKVWLRVPGLRHRLVAQSTGATRFAITPSSGMSLDATAVDSAGRVAATKLYLSSGAQSSRWIRVRDAVVKSGGAIVVGGEWGRGSGPVVVSLLKHGVPVASRLARVDGAGKLSATIFPPPGSFGLATIRATGLAWNQATGALETTLDQASLYLSPTELSVTIEGATRHKPGDNAKVGVLVSDAYGRPVPGAGLAAAVVDERILALSEPRPDLVEVLTTLDVANASSAGLYFVDLMKSSAASAPMARRAIIEALPPAQLAPHVELAAATRYRSELARIVEAEKIVYKVLYTDAAAIGARTANGRWEFRDPLTSVLARGGWKAERRVTPWQRPTRWAYARELVPEWTFSRVADRIANQRLNDLYARLRSTRKRSYKVLHKRTAVALKTLADGGQLDRHLIIDPWGSPVRATRRAEYYIGEKTYLIELASAGPDQRFGSNDDLIRRDIFSESLYGLGTVGYGAGGGGVGYGTLGSGRYGTIGHGSGVGMAPAVEVAVRRNFDETVLWVAGVRTDKRGRAAFEVPLADSITGWEVAVEAVGPHGSVGSAKARLETFMPLYVSAELPRGLTVGDDYVLSAVVANHTKRKQSLLVNATIGGGISLTGAPTSRVELPAGATTAVRVPIRATAVGTGTVRLVLAEGKRTVDIVERTLEVDPPGALVRDLRTGTVKDGSAGFSIEVPRGAVSGTVGGRIRLFRGAADQAVDGLEGMLREPYGCFEQTSSSTYPNLLVLSLLADKPGMEQVTERAKTLVGKGYQRLISYEVNGGGFSWFGESPANQVLTAYGLMEFVDMAKVYPVDPALIERTRKWILGKQGKDGAWLPDKSWLHDWSAVQGRLSTTAYIAWALAESDYRGKALDRALAYLRKHRGELSKNPYLLGLWAAAETRGGKSGKAALASLRKRAKRSGEELRFTTGGQTLFYASGVGADVQVTALAATALHRRGDSADAASALAWVWSARRPNYGWGTTQGTVMALRAAAELADRKVPREGSLTVAVDGAAIGTIDLAGAGVPGLDLPADLASGRHKLTLSGKVAGNLSADVRLAWRDSAAPKEVAKGLSVKLAVAEPKTRLGERVALTVTVANPGKDKVAMPTVVVPVPPGFSADADSLQALVGHKKIAKFEDQGAEIQLYLTELAPGAEIALAYSLEATAECDVTQRPARAYAYYNPETSGSSAGMRLVAGPRRPTGKAD